MGNQNQRICPCCLRKQFNTQMCKVCSRYICKSEKCWNYPILNVADKQQAKLSQIKYQLGCFECFKNNINLDLTKTFQIIGQKNKKQIIFVHGAGSSRKMFMSHAVQLQKLGYKSILIDLPRHGGRLNQALTIQSCVQSIIQATQLCQTQDFVIVGGSLGGYMLMQALGKHDKLCKKAVIMMAGQNVGVGRSKIASIGLWLMNKVSKHISQSTLAKLMIKQALKNGNLDEGSVLYFLKGGSYFKGSQQNIQVLKNADYLKSLQNNKRYTQLLFINGSQDYRDSEKIWLQAASESSILLNYEGADHFFSHDKRYFQRLIKDITNFIQN